MTEATKLQKMEEEWEICQAQENRKSSLITDLFKHISDLSHRLVEVEQKLEEKRLIIKSMWENTGKYKEQIDKLQIERDKHCFALVLIDGDCMPFLDHLVQQGLEGGKKSASLLKAIVQEELKSWDPAVPHHQQIIIRIYANLKGLAKTYTEMGLLSDPRVLEEFVRGFNMRDAMCDFTDAGNGKECTDEKMKANFKLGLADVHCRQILFGASPDSSYARLLESYLENEKIRDRIALIEGPPFAKELADIRDKFRTVSFNTILRNQKLLNIKRKVSFRFIPPSTPSMDYASVTQRAPQLQGSLPFVKQNNSAVSTIPITMGVFRNKAGQRVDTPLSYSHQDFINLKNRKMCNSFHLLGKCSFLDYSRDCTHEHGSTLSPSELRALCAVARYSPCHSGLGCSDPSCLYGHQCPRESCNGASCRLKFPLELHNIDKKILG